MTPPGIVVGPAPPGEAIPSGRPQGGAEFG